MSRETEIRSSRLDTRHRYVVWAFSFLGLEFKKMIFWQSNGCQHGVARLLWFGLLYFFGGRVELVFWYSLPLYDAPKYSVWGEIFGPQDKKKLGAY